MTILPFFGVLKVLRWDKHHGFDPKIILLDGQSHFFRMDNQLLGGQTPTDFRKKLGNVDFSPSAVLAESLNLSLISSHLNFHDAVASLMDQTNKTQLASFF